jgi:hypothetical protein
MDHIAPLFTVAWPARSSVDATKCRSLAQAQRKYFVLVVLLGLTAQVSDCISDPDARNRTGRPSARIA